MPSIFAPSPSCGIFAPTTDDCGDGLTQVLTFRRAAHLVTRSAPVQNASGEVVLSFVVVGSEGWEVQPKPAGYLRMIQGQVIEVNFVAFRGGPSVRQEGDRTYIDGKQVEVVNVLRYGNASTELELRQVGR